MTPFADLGSDATSKSYAAGLTAEIVDQLVKFKDIVIIAETPTPSAAASKGAGAPQFELTGSVRTSADRLRFLINLVDRTNGHVIWTKAYEDTVRVDTLFDFQKDVAATVATEIGQAYGIIIRANSARMGQRPPDNAEAYSCMMSYFAYRQGLVEAQHADVRACLERAVVKFSDFATGWALLAMVLLDEDRFGYNQQPNGPVPLARALEAAENAASLDPSNVRAQQALMNVYFFTNNVEMGLKTGRQALALNPNDMELLGEFGVRLATSGQWAEGDAMIERALAYNPSNANYYLTAQSAAAYMLQRLCARDRTHRAREEHQSPAAADRLRDLWPARHGRRSPRSRPPLLRHRFRHACEHRRGTEEAQRPRRGQDAFRRRPSQGGTAREVCFSESARFRVKLSANSAETSKPALDGGL